MSVNSLSPPETERARGRGWFWLGLLLCLLGPVFAAAQFVGLKMTVVPWYSPALALAGALLLLLSACLRPTMPRVFFFVLVLAFAGLQGHFLANLLHLPSYDGPVTVGGKLTPFASTFADGRAFSEADLRDGTRRALVFFRGRW